MPSSLTIVMYHYVRDLEASRYPNIKARRTSEFRSQLQYLCRNYVPVSMQQVIDCLRTDEILPENAVLLTFDDGYIDHYTTCFPILHDLGIQGAFFPPVATAKYGKLLDVNRVHFLLAVTEPQVLAAEIDAAVLNNSMNYELKKPEEYRAEWAHSTRFDNAVTIYVKRMLQHVLPEKLRNLLTRTLFARYVSNDEAAFASELYATAEQFKLMQSSGMYVGSHGDSHYWLNAISEEAQRREIDNSLAFLREIGSPVDDFWVMCYPYGAYNDSLLNTLRKSGCTIGLTVESKVARIGENDPLLLPRLDTNDIPW